MALEKPVHRALASTLTLAVVVVAGCHQTDRSEDASGIYEQVQGHYGGYDDTLFVARAAGVNYLDVVSRCLWRDPEAMHTLFWLSKHAGFDAASAEGHAGVLHDVLRDVGERFYARCLDAEPENVRNAVRSDLLYDMGWGECKKFSVIQQLWPKVFPQGYDPYRVSED